jgi:hypothetical protein
MILGNAILVADSEIAEVPVNSDRIDAFHLWDFLGDTEAETGRSECEGPNSHRWV